jgi:dipeptidyl aminopeptidase/acylaminoacyl peptidase
MKRGISGLFILVLLALPQAAQAAYPGQAGELAFTREHLVPDGNGFQRVSDSVWAAPPGGPARQVSPDDGYLGPTWAPGGRRIAYLANPDRGPFGQGIQIAAADGTPERLIRFSALAVVDRPTWSPDGKRLAFAGLKIDYPSSPPSQCARISVWTYPPQQPCDIDVYLVNADGTALTELVSGFDPAWSPNGDRIAYAAYDGAGKSEIHTIALDGSAHAQLTSNSARDEEPAWSPDGAELAFSSDRDGVVAGFDGAGGPGELYAMDAGGGNVRRLTADPAYDSSPAWAPDGSRIAFATTRRTPDCVPNPFVASACSSDAYTMNTDGSDPQLAASPAFDVDWQARGSYARPKAASPIYLPLVPAYKECEEPPNRMHSAPLAFGSCGPPEASEDCAGSDPCPLSPPHLTLGTPDANGQRAQSTAFVRLHTVLGDPATEADEADVTVDVSVTDVRSRSDLSDYTGELQARTVVRMTDYLSGPGSNEPGTVEDFEFPFTVRCSETPDQALGATCLARTSFDAILPGSVPERARAIWQLETVRLYDGGADGQADTGPNTLFEQQGIFLP